MSYRVIEAETGEIIAGGLNYHEAECFREKFRNSDSYFIEDEPEPEKEATE